AVHWKKVQRVVPWLLPEGDPPDREYIVEPESMIDITQSMACIHCGACVSACLSMEVDPEFIGPAALAKAYRFVGYPRDAFPEAQLLPKSYGDGSLIRAQVKPAALKELTAKLPTVIRGLRSGKVSPKTALIHRKLKDQDQIRRMYKEVESHEDRLELNLYIVGDSDAEEEGTMAEGGQEG